MKGELKEAVRLVAFPLWAGGVSEAIAAGWRVQVWRLWVTGRGWDRAEFGKKGKSKGKEWEGEERSWGLAVASAAVWLVVVVGLQVGALALPMIYADGAGGRAGKVKVIGT